MQKELISGMGEGGFTLAKWSSNEQELLDHLPSDTVKQLGEYSDGAGMTKLLGNNKG